MDIVQLLFKAQTSDLDRAEKKLDDVGKSAKGAQQNLDKAGVAGKVGGAGIATGAVSAKTAVTALTTSLRTLLAPLVAIQTVVSFVRISSESEQLMMRLQTATGSIDNARIAMGALQDFAKSTPYSLSEVTNSFQKLVNLGLDPSEAALRSYGNTASAMGKSMDQMIEAVADAAKGEFERLKEFGITAKKQGDQVSFTFQGVTTQVRNSSAEIEKYLQNIGNTKFGDAMDNQANTFAGAMSNMGDAVEGLVRKISEGGVQGALTTMVRQATKIIEDFGNWLTTDAGDMWRIFSVAVTSSTDTAESAVWKFVKSMGGSLYNALGSALNGMAGAFAYMINGTIYGFDTLGAVVKEVVADVSIGAAALKKVMSGEMSVSEAWSWRVSEQAKTAEQRTKDLALAAENLRRANRDVGLMSASAEDGYKDPRLARRQGDGTDPLADFRKGGSGSSSTGSTGKSETLTLKGDATGPFTVYLAELQEKAKRELEDLARYEEREAAADREYESLMQRVKGYKDLADPTQKFRDMQAQLSLDYATGLVPLDAYIAKQKELLALIMQATPPPPPPPPPTTFTEGWRDAFAQYQKYAVTAADVGAEAFRGATGMMEDGIMQFVTTGKVNFKSLVADFLKGIAQMIAKQLAFNAIKGAMGFMGFADGGAFNKGTQFFANGGVVNRATAFGMAGGKTGVMGEAGPEAIMPLKRGPDGKLGVAGVGGGGGKNVTVQNTISVHIGSVDSNERQREMMREIEKVVSVTTKKTLADQMRPGGMLARA